MCPTTLVLQQPSSAHDTPAALTLKTMRPQQCSPQATSASDRAPLDLYTQRPRALPAVRDGPSARLPSREAASPLQGCPAGRQHYLCLCLLRPSPLVPSPGPAASAAAAPPQIQAAAGDLSTGRARGAPAPPARWPHGCACRLLRSEQAAAASCVSGPCGGSTCLRGADHEQDGLRTCSELPRVAQQCSAPGCEGSAQLFNTRPHARRKASKRACAAAACSAAACAAAA